MWWVGYKWARTVSPWKSRCICYFVIGVTKELRSAPGENKGCLGSQFEARDKHWLSGVSSEQPHMGAENQIRVLCKSIKHPNHWAILPAPSSHIIWCSILCVFNTHIYYCSMYTHRVIKQTIKENRVIHKARHLIKYQNELKLLYGSEGRIFSIDPAMINTFK